MAATIRQIFRDGYLAGPRPAERGQEIAVEPTTTPRRLVLRTMWGANRYTIPAMILMILHFVGEALVPVIMGLAIDRAVLEQDWNELLIWLVILAADFVLLSVTWRIGERMAIYGLHVVEHQWRMRITDRLLDPVGSAGPARLPGTALSIATSDVSRLSRAVLLAVFPVGEMAAVIVAGVILLWISWPLGVAVLLGAPVVFWLLDKVGAPLRRRTQQQQESVGVAAGTAADLMAGFRVLKGIGAENEAADRYHRVSRNARDRAIAAMRTEGAYIGILQFATAVFVIAVGVAAGVMAVSGHIGLGGLITVVGLTQFILGPLNAIGANFGAVWNGAVPSAERVLSVLQAGPASSAGDAPATRGRLAIGGHDGVPETVIPETGLTVIATDQSTASQLTDALSHDDRTFVRVVPHAPHLFEGSVIDNIEAVVADGPGRADAVARAVLAAACDDIAEVLPEGLDTEVGEAGHMLSGGQRQRVGLARALAAPSHYLLLTDPTTAVDSVTEARIVDRVRTARTGQATVVFTQSPAWVAAADTVIRWDAP